MSPPADRPDLRLDAVYVSHRRLLDHLGGIAAVDPARPSRLSGWSVGHVLTHLARNADSFVRILAGAERGEVVDQYVGGADGRNADIERGAVRPWNELVTDVGDSIARLEAAFATHSRWSGRCRTIAERDVPVTELPFRRWREVEVHHVDLGLDGYGPASWPDDYVREELERLGTDWRAQQPSSADLPDAARHASPRDRLAWLLGRIEIDGLPPADVF